jgi:hypothetical protein
VLFYYVIVLNKLPTLRCVQPVVERRQPHSLQEGCGSTAGIVKHLETSTVLRVDLAT